MTFNVTSIKSRGAAARPSYPHEKRRHWITSDSCSNTKRIDITTQYWRCTPRTVFPAVRKSCKRTMSIVSVRTHRNKAVELNTSYKWKIYGSWHVNSPEPLSPLHFASLLMEIASSSWFPNWWCGMKQSNENKYLYWCAAADRSISNLVHFSRTIRLIVDTLETRLVPTRPTISPSVDEWSFKSFKLNYFIALELLIGWRFETAEVYRHA